jgi:predicted nucleic acid-binding protein
MYTLDASVWVNAFDQREPGHEASREFLALLGSLGLPIIVPTLLLVEVAAAISRTRQNPAEAETFAQAIAVPSHVHLIPLDQAMASRALALAALRGLRGADAIYATVAADAGCVLVSRDNEHLTRLTGVVTVQTPETVLDELTRAHQNSSPHEPPAGVPPHAQEP